MQYSPSSGNVLAFGAGAAAGSGTTAAMSWAKRLTGKVNMAGGVSLANAGISLVGGNANATIAATCAQNANDTNSLLFTAGGATGPEVGNLKKQVADLWVTVGKVAGNTDPLTVVGLRNAPTFPVASTASTSGTVPAPVNTTPSTGLGNIGIALLLGVAVWAYAKSE